MHASALISSCGHYRYNLARAWHPEPSRVILWVMLNPSTADAEADDPTIRKITGFSKLWGYHALRVVNLYAFRATDPKELRKKCYPIGEENDHHIFDALLGSQKVVAAWGCHAQRRRASEVLKLLKSKGDVWCLGRTQMGCPKHPLFVKYDTPLEKM